LRGRKRKENKESERKELNDRNRGDAKETETGNQNFVEVKKN